MTVIKLAALSFAAFFFLSIYLLRTTALSMENEEIQPTVLPSRSSTNVTSRIEKKTLCEYVIKEEDSIKFLTLTEHSLVNMVYVHFVYEDINNKNTLIIWVNGIGRKILLLRDTVTDSSQFLSTLAVGRRSLTIYVKEKPKGCVMFNNKKQIYYAEEKLLDYYGPRIKPNEELCYGLVSNKVRPRQCCQFIKTGIGKKRNDCYKSTGSLLNIKLGWKLITILFSLSLLTMNALYLYHLYCRQFHCHKDYYTLTESPVSLLRVKIFGRGISSCDELSLACFVLLFVLVSQIGLVWFVIYIFIWIKIGKHSRTKGLQSLDANCFNKYFIRRYERIFKIDTINGNEFQRAVCLFTLPCNPKLWHKVICNCRSITKDMKFRCNFVNILFFSTYIVFFTLFTTIIFFINFFYNALMFTATSNVPLFKFKNCCRYYIRIFFRTSLLIFFFAFLWILIPFFILPIVLGLILNSVYFLPYITFTAVVGFYTWRSWKSLEGKYFSLKMIIYEVLKDRQTNNRNHPGDIKENESIEHVVSKKLYHKIRKKLLPYNSVFFVFGIKFVFVIFFSFGVFKLLMMLQAVDASPTIIVIATLTTGALPHILNIIMATVSDDGRKAHNETMRSNVERLVDKLTKDDSELSLVYLTTTIITPENKSENQFVSQQVDDSGEVGRNASQSSDIAMSTLNDI